MATSKSYKYYNQCTFVRNRGKGPYSPTPADESDGDDDGHDDVEGSTASSKGKYNQKGGSRTGGKSTGKDDASWKGACDTGDHGNHGKGNQGKPSSVAAAAAAAAAAKLFGMMMLEAAPAAIRLHQRRQRCGPVRH